MERARGRAPLIAGLARRAKLARQAAHAAAERRAARASIDHGRRSLLMRHRSTDARFSGARSKSAIDRGMPLEPADLGPLIAPDAGRRPYARAGGPRCVWVGGARDPVKP